MKLLHRALLAGALAGAAAPHATAAGRESGGHFDLYYVPRADLEVVIPGFGSGEDDGDGYGLRGLGRLGGGFAILGEVGSTKYDDSGIEVEQVRVGFGFFEDSGSGLYLEYDNIELDGSDADGPGLHGRLAGEVTPGIVMYADVGYLRLEDDFEKSTGLEYTVGAVFALAPGRGGLFVDYRVTSLEGEDTEVEFEFTDLRLGVRLPF